MYASMRTVSYLFPLPWKAGIMYKNKINSKS
jgi:hypothetical protein